MVDPQIGRHEITRRHYEKLDQHKIAKRSVERRLRVITDETDAPPLARGGIMPPLTTRRICRKLFAAKP